MQYVIKMPKSISRYGILEFAKNSLLEEPGLYPKEVQSFLFKYNREFGIDSFYTYAKYMIKDRFYHYLETGCIKK